MPTSMMMTGVGPTRVPPVSTYSVITFAGTLKYPSFSVSNSTGSLFTVTRPVTTSTGTSYNPL